MKHHGAEMLYWLGAVVQAIVDEIDHVRQRVRSPYPVVYRAYPDEHAGSAESADRAEPGMGSETPKAKAKPKVKAPPKVKGPPPFRSHC